MNKEKTFAQKVIEYNDKISNISIELPKGFRVVNPFNGENRTKVKDISKIFYTNYYDDNNNRSLIIGSSPAKRGTGVTGIPFEDSINLQKETGILIDEYYISKSSSEFIYNVIEEYGGRNAFYSDFYMNFVCPIGIVKNSVKGNEINCNYYESKKLKEKLYSLIITNIEEIINLGKAI